MLEKKAKFNVGDIVFHKKQRYLAIIIDIDPLFQPSGRYNPGVENRSFANNNPWYRLLVDGTHQTTYVEEPLLESAQKKNMIDNPDVDNYFRVKQGSYVSIEKKH